MSALLMPFSLASASRSLYIFHGIFHGSIGYWQYATAIKALFNMSRFVRTHRARKTFLDCIESGSSFSLAAAAAGGRPGNFKSWIAADEDFRKDYEDALEAGTDVLEDAAFNRAVTKSDALAIFLLKARRPEKYDRGSKLELSGEISVEGAKSKLLNKIARLQSAGDISLGGSETIDGLPGKESAEGEEVKLLPAPDPADTGRGRKRRAASQGS